LPVGNDVVDLRHPFCQPDAIHPRFDTRAFSAREIALLAATEKAHQMRWSLWAAKESAFKALRKVDSRARFIPRDFEVVLGDARAEVTHRLARFSVWLDHSDQWVHAVASQAGEKPKFRLDGDSSADPGSEEEGLRDRVRRLASSALGGLLEIAPSEIEVVSVNRIPQAQRQGQLLPFDLSLSHDGRFVSCAWESI
jgi:phosphopantetheinyl transferase (holo-ACP synthase)